MYSQIKKYGKFSKYSEKFFDKDWTKRHPTYTGLVINFQTQNISQTQPHLEPTIPEGISVLKFE